MMRLRNPLSKWPSRSVMTNLFAEMLGGGNGMELLGKISQVFDPAAQHARDQQQAQCSLENTQIMMLSQQLRDSQNMIEGLHTQLTQLQARVHDMERARDC